MLPTADSDLPANAQLIHHAGMAKHTVHPNRPQTTNFPQASATGSQHTPRSAPAFTVELCARDPERDQRLAQLEAQQPPLHSAWLHILQTSISELAGNKGSHKGGPLSVPWPWLVHDFLRLLPETSCYTILLDDPGIFSNLLQQVTDPDPDALSSAGAQTLAQIVSELAQKAPARLVNYAKTHNAILHRLKQVCSELLRHAAQGTDQSTKLQAAAQFYAQQLASSFLATPTADRKAQRNTLKLAMSIISLLPEHIQAVTHTQLLSPYNDMIQDYLRNKEFPDYMELAHVSLAVHFIESFLANPSLQPQVSANTISRWTVWSLQPASFETQPELQVRTAQLAVAACQLIHHSTANKSVSKRTLIDGFIDQVLAELQPRHLQARIDAWQGSNDEHVINLVRFSALLVNANLKQLDSSSETSCCNRQELVQQLKAAAATVNPKLVKSVLIKDMQSAIQQVKKNTPNKCVAATKHGVPEPSSQHLRHRHSQQSNEAQTPRHGSGQLPQPASQPAGSWMSVLRQCIAL